MATPFFSIVIPVYNGITNDLPKCLDSIWGQSLDKKLYEVICVDDCSTDNTRQWLKKECERHSNLHIIENDTNIRQGGSRNKGVKAEQGKYLIFIDQNVSHWNKRLFLLLRQYTSKINENRGDIRRNYRKFLYSKVCKELS